MLKSTRKRGFPSVLSRSLAGHHSSSMPKRSRRPLGLGLLGCGLVVGFFLLLPKPAPRLRNVALSDDQLRSVLSASRLPPTVSRGVNARVDLGRRLFHSSGLSPHEGRTCVSCHDGGRRTQPAQATVKPDASATPELANLDRNGWFGHDGRSDSLAAACLAAVEGPGAMGGSRLAALALVKKRFLPAYEEAFGAWPTQLANLPSAGLPAPQDHKLPINVAAQGLATLGSFPLLEGLLNQANQLHATPAVELSKRAFAGPPPPPAQWTAAFATLTVDQQAAANQVFAHLGQAMAAYLTGLVTDDAPYDRFAARMLQGRSASEALGEGFGEAELTGLKLFAGPGQCQACHSGPRFSDGVFHNVGLAQRGEMVQAGRATGLQIALADPFNCRGAFLPQVAEDALLACKQLLGMTAGPGAVGDLGAYKTPSLRNIAKRTPYMHDGRLASLPEVLHYYNRLDEKPAIGTRDPLLHPLGFTEEEVGAVIRFLASLNAPVRDLNQLQTASARP